MRGASFAGTLVIVLIAILLGVQNTSGAEITDEQRERAYREASRAFLESHAVCRSTFAFLAQCIGTKEQEGPLDQSSAVLRTEAIEAAKTLALREEGLHEKLGTTWPEFDAERRKSRAAAVGSGLACPLFLEARREQINGCRDLVAHPGDRFQASFDAAVTGLSGDEADKGVKATDGSRGAQPDGNAAAAQPALGKASGQDRAAPGKPSVKPDRQRSLAVKPFVANDDDKGRAEASKRAATKKQKAAKARTGKLR